ncbi:MAG: 4Fe-4S binding protein [Eubacteriales bacterium]|nr:4Fe-4S binding protein [Eubacteriales bacterium]
MIRTIINIDKEKCNGCELCVNACHEGAIAMIDGKAELIRDDYCDGLGNCLPVCPTGAITFVEREAAAFDEAAVAENMKNQAADLQQHTHGHMQPDLACGCPGSQSRTFNRENTAHNVHSAAPAQPVSVESQLQQWPVQIQLVPVNAPYFDGANLLIAADCAAYAYADFHNGFIRNRITLIGCPKLDNVDYSEKLTAILANNEIKSVTVVRMEVPCCGGIQNAIVTALKNSGKMIPWQIVTISTDGRILE